MIIILISGTRIAVKEVKNNSGYKVAYSYPRRSVQILQSEYINDS